MKKLDTDKYPRAATEREIIESYDAPTEYCDKCWIAFGSHENRILKDRKKLHLDCVART
jgi:hypothetical protein